MERTDLKELVAEIKRSMESVRGDPNGQTHAANMEAWRLDIGRQINGLDYRTDLLKRRLDAIELPARRQIESELRELCAKIASLAASRERAETLEVRLEEIARLASQPGRGLI